MYLTVSPFSLRALSLCTIKPFSPCHNVIRTHSPVKLTVGGPVRVTVKTIDLDPDLNEPPFSNKPDNVARHTQKNQNRWTQHSCKLHFAVAEADLLLIEPVLINVPITKNCSRANVRIGSNVTCGTFVSENGTQFTFEQANEGSIEFYFRQWIQI